MHARFLRIALAVSLALLLTPASAMAAADADKVDRLLTLMKLEANVAQMEQMIVQSMEQSFRQGLAGESLTPEQERRAEAMLNVMKQSFARMFSWEVMGPEYRRIYQEVLTNEEIEGAIAYYESPAGASMLAKNPELMRRGMEMGQRRAQELVPQMQAEMAAAIAEIKSGDAE